MLLTVDEMVALLRSSVNVQSKESEVIDPAFLVMTDDDIKLFIKLGVTRAYPDVDDLRELPDGSEFAIVLLAKIELYLKLAVTVAPKVDLGADNNNYLKQDQRFQHYMKLAEEARQQYDDWLENEGGSGTVTAYDMLLSKRHYSNRNYEKQVTPKLRLLVDEVTTDSVDFRWKLLQYSHFGVYKVYISETPIIDIYADGMYYSDKVSKEAKLVKSTSNIRDTYHSISGLKPETTYFVAVIEVERNQVFCYSEVSFTTLNELKEDEDISIDDINEAESGEENAENNVEEKVDDKAEENVENNDVEENHEDGE